MTWEQIPDPSKLIRYRQDDDGSLVFAIRVHGLPASSRSPREVAEDLVRNWTAKAGGIARMEIEPPDVV